MQKWEYLEITVKGGKVVAQDGEKTHGNEAWKDCLRDLGETSWELFIKLPHDTRSFPDLYFTATFKRPIT